MQDEQRRLGLWENPHVFEIRRLLLDDWREASKLADEARHAENAQQIKAIEERLAERRRWRIENGLEDPPRGTP